MVSVLCLRAKDHPPAATAASMERAALALSANRLRDRQPGDRNDHMKRNVVGSRVEGAPRRVPSARSPAIKSRILGGIGAAKLVHANAGTPKRSAPAHKDGRSRRNC